MLWSLPVICLIYGQGFYKMALVIAALYSAMHDAPSGHPAHVHGHPSFVSHMWRQTPSGREDYMIAANCRWQRCPARGSINICLDSPGWGPRNIGKPTLNLHAFCITHTYLCLDSLPVSLTLDIHWAVFAPYISHLSDYSLWSLSELHNPDRICLVVCISSHPSWIFIFCLGSITVLDTYLLSAKFILIQPLQALRR